MRSPGCRGREDIGRGPILVRAALERPLAARRCVDVRPIEPPHLAQASGVTSYCRAVASMDHLAIPVRDQERSRRFHETYFGFGARPALGLPHRDAVLALCARLSAGGVELVEEWDEPEYVSVQCRDPDGYIVEAAWEPER